MAEAGAEDCLVRCFITVVISGPGSATHRDVGNTKSCREHDWCGLRPEGSRGAACGMREKERRLRDRALLAADRGPRTFLNVRI